MTDTAQIAVHSAAHERRTLPELLSQAGQRLLDARSSGEVLEAKKIAEMALHLAKVTKAANETHADCLRVITRAEMRMADEIDKGQEDGDVARAGNPNVRSSGNSDPPPATLADLGVSRQRVAEWRKIRDAGEPAVEQAIKAALDEGRAPTKEDINRAAHVRGTFGTGDNEWFTPADVIHDVRAVLGVIDLDPASTERAQATVQALQYFTIADDGLKRDWHGNVWLNPPYAQPFIEHFADKMIAEIDAGRVKQAIVLTHCYCDTAWFQKLARKAHLVCFPKGRIRFEAPDGSLASPTQGQAFFYFGTAARARFVEVFAARGVVGVLNGDTHSVAALHELAEPDDAVRVEIERRIAAGELATIEDVETVKAKIAEIVAMAVEYARTIDRLRKQNRDLMAMLKMQRLSNKQALARAIEKEIAEGGAA